MSQRIAMLVLMAMNLSSPAVGWNRLEILSHYGEPDIRGIGVWLERSSLPLRTMNPSPWAPGKPLTIVTTTPSQPLSVPAWSEFTPNPKASEIEQLCEDATHMQGQQAEAALHKAISLNEVNFNSGIYSYMVGVLSHIYRTEGRLADFERLQQVASKRLGWWDSQQFRDGLADFFMETGRYAEARAILRHFVPQMKPPHPYGHCGNPYMRYAREQGKYRACMEKTNTLTDVQLDAIEKQVRGRYVAGAE